jgi:hypothetical protein
VERLRFEHIIDMGLAWSAMMRVFEKGAKVKLQSQIVNNIAEKIFNAPKEEFLGIHQEFCDWGTENVKQRDGKSQASYGQIAKTLDVTLKVAVYYCHLPDCEKYEEICGWLNAAVDTAMMRDLKKRREKDFPDLVKSWPTSLKKVDTVDTYHRVQQLVREDIKREHNGATGPQWEDIHWEEANKKFQIKLQ